jgi:hypothetical protein
MAEQATTRPQWVVETIKAKGASRRAAYEKREKEALRLKEQVHLSAGLILNI